MTSVLGYARTFYVGGTYRPDDLPSLEEEASTRLHPDAAASLARRSRRG